MGHTLFGKGSSIIVVIFIALFIDCESHIVCARYAITLYWSVASYSQYTESCFFVIIIVRAVILPSKKYNYCILFVCLQ